MDENEKSLWMRNPRRHSVRDMDTFANAPSSPWGKWLGGVAVSAFMLWHGVKACVTLEAVFRGRHGATMDLHGNSAIAYGCAVIFLAAFSHFHFFWGNVERLAAYHHAGKVLSLSGFVCSLGILFWRIFSEL